MRRFWLRKPLFAVAALALAAGLTAVGLSQSFSRKAGPPAGPVVRRANPEAPRPLGGRFARLSGTRFLMAAIGSGGAGDYSGLGKSSSDTVPIVHNYAFLDLSDRSVRRLIATNDSLILGVEELPGAGDGSPVGGPLVEGKARVRWLLYDVVKQDTNRDGMLDATDLRTLAVSDAGGRNYTELIGGIRDTYGRALHDPNTLVVIYQGESGKSVSVIDLSGRAVTSTAAIPDLGPDVK